MSKLSRLIGMATKALDSTSGGSASSSAPPARSGDWRTMARSAADALMGEGRAPAASGSAPAPTARSAATSLTPPPANGAPSSSSSSPLSPADRQAIARYDYLLQTADPHQVEQIHQEAFSRLTPEQRAHVQARMVAELPAHEHPRSAAPADLARVAARTEAARPGMLRGLLSRVNRGGAGRAAGGAAIGAGVGVLGVVAGGAILTSVAGPLLAQAAGMGVDFDALAQGVDLEGLAGGALSDVGEHVSGVGEQVAGFGENLGGFELPGLGNLFGR
ncbi:cation-transporting ATPase [Microbacterium oleivorans]|uniref:cation-transporting ATPase n=1 Tax=Microbacterium oleivorans TaxID=273677 RepID=UPI0010A38F1C|nr:cation-transporting ATPase [Microbacterium oleivorans]THE06201.1 cation-transporting ATPase [Microbacterium oleivorans]